MYQQAKPLYPDEIKFLKENYFLLNHEEIFQHINQNRPKTQRIGRTCLRSKCYRMGLKKGIQIRWSKKDEIRLKKWFCFMGDKQIAEILNEIGSSYRKINGKKVYRKFTKKNIEKKRELLGLKRTNEQVLMIVSDNKLCGDMYCFTKSDNAWTNGKRNIAKEQEIRIWSQDGIEKRYIKINGRFIPYTRWFYQNFVDDIPPGGIIFHIDLDKLNDSPENLQLRFRKNQTITKSDYRNAKILIEKRIDLQIKMNEKKFNGSSFEYKKQMMKELIRLKNRLKIINKKLN